MRTTRVWRQIEKEANRDRVPRERDLTWSRDAVVFDDDDDQLLTCCCSFCPGTRNPRLSSSVLLPVNHMIGWSTGKGFLGNLHSSRMCFHFVFGL